MIHPQFAPLVRGAAFQRLLARTQRIIDAMLDVSRTPYVAFSAGKDSSVLLALVRAARPDVIAIYTDDEWRLPETDELLAATPNLRRVARPVAHTEWFTAHADGPPADAEWLEDVPAWGRGLGYDGAFVGLRAEESRARRVLLHSRGPLFWNARRHSWQCCPLRDWTTQDIWAYIQAWDVPYNRAYDVLAQLGVPITAQRIGPLAVERVPGRGQLAILRQGWPELWNRFAAAHPEARAYL